MSRSSIERRRHKRLDVCCPVWLVGEGDRVIARSRTVNVSNGGILILSPLGAASSGNGAAKAYGELPAGGKLAVRFSVPRKTANTFMFEDFAVRARVVRAVESGAGVLPGLALQFDQPLKLELEV